MTSSADLVDQIRELGLPDVVARIATEGGESVSPALVYRADSVFHEPADVVARGTSEDLVPLWSCGTEHVFAGRGRYLVWGPESEEPSAVFETFSELVRRLLTDLWGDPEDDDERARIAHLLLPPDDAVAALLPRER